MIIMNHYQNQPKKPRESKLRSYIKLAEEKIAEQRVNEKEKLNKYARRIAERVNLKEGRVDPNADYFLSDLITAKELAANAEYNPKSGKLYHRFLSAKREEYGPEYSMHLHQAVEKAFAHQHAMAESTEGIDSVSMDIPLLIRILEYAREDAKNDKDLHFVAERLIKLSEGGITLNMNDYNTIVGSRDKD